MQNIISKLNHFAYLWALMGGVLLCIIAGVTFTNAVLFMLGKIVNFFNIPNIYISGLTGFEDFVRLTIGVVASMFFPYCQAQDGHVKVDAFLKKTPLNQRIIIDKIWMIVGVLLSLFLLYWLIFGMIETYNDKAVSRVLGWVEWPFYIVPVLSVGLWSIIGFFKIFTRDDMNKTINEGAD